MRLLSVRPALALAVVVTATACGTLVDATHDGGADGPTDLGPAAAHAPAGTKQVVCDLTGSGREADVRFALDLPKDVRPGRVSARGCSWSHAEKVPGEGYTTRVVVEVRAVPDGASLQDEYDDEEPYAVEDGDFAGDETIYDLRLDEDVATFGRTLGDQLSYRCFCDGQDLLTRMAQADGVRVTWSSVQALRAQTDAEVEQALTGAGTDEPAATPDDRTTTDESPTEESPTEESPTDEQSTEPPVDPTALQPASPGSPPGTERQVCVLGESDEVVRFALDLPDDVRAGRTTERACTWRRRERVHGNGLGAPYPGFVVVSTTVSLADSEAQTLQQMYDQAEPTLVEDGEFEGDGTVFELSLDDDVAVFGDTRGQRFTEHCYCDGQDPITRAFEADGVRVTWQSHVDLEAATDREIERALAGAGLAP